MAQRIKGITIDIDGNATGLEKALKSVDASLRDTQSKLKDVNKLLKLDPSNIDLLKQKQEYLNKAVGDTKKRHEELTKALEQMEKAGITEENQEQQRALQRELVETKVKMDDLQKQADACHPALESFSAKAKGVSEATRGISTVAAGAAVGMVGMAVKAAASADDLLTLSNVTGFTVEELQKMQYASSFIDVSMEAMTGSITKLTKNMESGSTAFDTLGIKTRDVFGNLRDANSVFYEAVEALSHVQNETERDALSMEIFGKSAMEMAGIIDDGGAALKALGEEAEATGLIMGTDAVESAVKFNDQMDKLKNTTTQAFFTAGASLAETLLPAFERLVTAVTNAVVWFGNLDGVTQGMILGALGLVAAISPIAGLLGSLNTIVTVVGGAFTALAAPVTVMGVEFAALAAPIGIAIAAVGALIAIGVLLYKNWDEIMAWGKKLGKDITQRWESIKSSIGKTVANIKQSVTTAFNNAKQSVSTAMSNMASSVANSSIVTNARTVFNNVSSAVSTKMTEAKNAVTGFLSDAIGAFNNSTIGSTVTTKFQGIYQTISSKFSDAYDAVATAIDNMKKKIDDTNMDKNVNINVYEKKWNQSGSAGTAVYASAYENPVMFTRPTVIPTVYGNKMFGDRTGAEIVVGANKLMSMIHQAAGGGNTVINMTVNGTGLNANQVADLAVTKITAKIQRNNQRW